MSARKSLIPYTTYTKRNYVPGPHHWIIANRLEALARGEINRLMILAHPRSGKSELASIRMPSWYLGHYPDRQVICVSYGSRLAESFGRQVRNTVASREYQRLFPNVTLASDSKSVGLWHTSAGGVYLSTGISGAATGFGAHLLVADDVLKGREEADSEVVPERIYDNFIANFYTRLQRDAAILWIYTPWSEDDPGMRLLAAAEAAGEHWTVLRLPARDERGAPLWPSEFPEERLSAIQGMIGAREWNALYMCRPTAEEGDYWQRKWLVGYSELPAKLRVYGASDYAVTTGGGDYTVHVVVGVAPDGAMYLLDLWRGQAGPDEWIDAFCDLVARWRPLEWAEEAGQIRSALGPAIMRRMVERRVQTYRRAFASRADKGVRAQSMRSRAAMRGLHVPKAASWYPDFEHELLAFPGGKHDDQHDALGLVGQLLDHIFPPREDAPPKSRDTSLSVARGESNVTFIEHLEAERKKDRAANDGW